MGSSSTPTTQTTRVDLAPQQQELLNLALPSLREFAANPPRLPEGSTISPFDPLQQQGQEMALASVPQQGSVVRAAADTSNSILNPGFLIPDSNPALRATIDASTRPIIQNLLEQALPIIRGGAVTTGNFGSSRQGIAEGLATGRAAQAVGDTSAKVATTGYGQGLDAQLKALSLAPTTAGALSIPAATTSAVGDVRQNMAQRLLDEITSRFSYQELLPLLMGKELVGVTGAIPGAGATTTASVAKPNPVGASLGGALGGAAAGSAFGPIGTAGGAIIGGLLPWLNR